MPKLESSENGVHAVVLLQRRQWASLLIILYCVHLVGETEDSHLRERRAPDRIHHGTAAAAASSAHETIIVIQIPPPTTGGSSDVMLCFFPHHPPPPFYRLLGRVRDSPIRPNSTVSQRNLD